MAVKTDMEPFRISRSGLDLIKRLEGFRDGPMRLDNGRWVIGYGHVFVSRPKLAVTPKEAEILLLYDLSAIGQALEALIFTPLNQNQTDALFSFVYNIGLWAFAESDVLSLINQGALVPAAAAMELWCTADLRGHSMVIDVLVRRRAAEKALFLKPPGGWRPAPSHILVPLAQTRLDPEPVALGIDFDLSNPALPTPFDPRLATAVFDKGAGQSRDALGIEAVWKPNAKAGPKAADWGSALIMSGVAITSFGLIGMATHQGLSVPPAPGMGVGSTLIAWFCGLSGVLVLAMVARKTILKVMRPAST